MKKTLSSVTILILFLQVLILFSCQRGGEDEGFLVSGLILEIYDGNKKAAEREIKQFLREFENGISNNIESSMISELNKAEIDNCIVLCDDVYKALRLAEYYRIATNNAYNPYLYRISSEIWGFSGDKITPPQLFPPEKARIDELLINTNGGLEFSEKNGVYSVKKTADISVDLGGIAKGYAADRCAEIARRNKVTSAFMSIAGEVRVIGENKSKKRPFIVGITDPRYNET